MGLLSNLFTTLDVSHHEDDHEGSELRKLPVPQGPNPVGDIVIAIAPTPQSCGNVIVALDFMGSIVIVPLGHDAFGPHSVNNLIIAPYSVGSDVIVLPYGQTLVFVPSLTRVMLL